MGNNAGLGIDAKITIQKKIKSTGNNIQIQEKEEEETNKRRKETLFKNKDKKGIENNQHLQKP